MNVYNWFVRYFKGFFVIALRGGSTQVEVIRVRVIRRTGFFYRWLVGNVTFFMCVLMCCQASCTSAQFNFLLDFAFDFSYITVKMAAHELRSSSLLIILYWLYKSRERSFQTLYKIVYDWTKSQIRNLHLGSSWKVLEVEWRVLLFCSWPTSFSPVIVLLVSVRETAHWFTSSFDYSK